MNCKKPIRLLKTGPSGIKNIEYFVGCGKCVACMEKKRNEMSLRNFFELCDHNHRAVFVTLTYEDEKIPKVNGSPSLSMRDFQLFMKRLRKRLQPLKIRYYGCGEYGPRTHRPHYHIILYGLTNTLENYGIIKDCWKKGFITIRACDIASIRYTSKYMLTKLLGDWEPPVKEFHLSSRNPGIGLPYLAKNPEFKHIFRDNLNDTYTMPGGYKLRLDRYLCSKIFSDTDRHKLSERAQEYHYENRLHELIEFERVFPDLQPETKEYTDKFKQWKHDNYSNWERAKLKRITKSHIL